MEVILQCSTVDGSEEIKLADNSQVSFGRGSEADHRFADDGLSRLHSTVYREGNNIWVTDEGSTNGTFVNGEQVSGRGTPLQDGDRIKIGNYTSIRVKFVQTEKAQTQAQEISKPTKTVSSAKPSMTVGVSSLLPIAIITFGILLIGVSALFVGYMVINSGSGTVVSKPTPEEEEDPIETPEENKSGGITTPTPKLGTSTPTNSGGNNNTNLTNSPEAPKTPQTPIVPSGKKYLDMSDAERRQYIESRAQKVAALIGNHSSEAIPALAIDRIKSFLDAYAKRANVARMQGCKFGDNLQATYERASKNAPFIIRAFNQQGIDPQIGMYLAMIESEHCVCLQSPTGPLGMYQFTYLTAKAHFGDSASIVKGASPSNPDDRCKPEPAANAAASYMKFLTGRYGTGPSSFPLAIGSYNSGEGGLSSNLKTALESNEGLPRDFWSLIANSEKLSKQFQAENFKYVPKFFAAAIVGENPADFGLTLQPLSTYTK
ncbi:MAG: FHA domain-containing protein [Pyrinomonadaceae bacterium]|nr:FHA domain-containing protein [Pyrinomonadaceae bacterium]